MVSVLPVLHAQWPEAPPPVGTQAPQVPPLLSEESTVDLIEVTFFYVMTHFFSLPQDALCGWLSTV